MSPAARRQASAGFTMAAMGVMAALLGILLAVCLGVFLAGKLVQRRLAKCSPAIGLGR